MKISQAPGRVELLGNHTDYNNGFVLPAAINANTVAKGIKSDKIILKSSKLKSRVEIPASILKAKNPTELVNKLRQYPSWVAYPLGVAYLLKIESGFNISYSGNLPLNVGLSSSASIEASSISFI